MQKYLENQKKNISIALTFHMRNPLSDCPMETNKRHSKQEKECKEINSKCLEELE